MLIFLKKFSLAPLAGDCCDKSHQFSRSLALARNSKKQQRHFATLSHGLGKMTEVIEARKVNFPLDISDCI